jgi:hypothetical protein
MSSNHLTNNNNQVNTTYDSNDEDDFPIRQVPHDNQTDNDNNQGAPTPARAPPAYGAFSFGPAGGNLPTTTASSFGSMRPPTTVAGMGMGFSCFQPPTTGIGFGNLGVPSVSRHPETGQPINRGACGGIQPPGIPFGFRPADDKKKNIDTIYTKLAQVRAKIAELNKFLDDIYETLPKIN